jgi:ketosteroid isomerase-like protein
MSFKAEVQTLLDQMAASYCAGDAAGCAALFAEDGQLHSPFAPPAVGRAAIERLHEAWTREGGSKFFEALDCGAEGSLGWCLCRFSEGDHTGDGTSLIVLVRGPSGDWLVRSCCLFGESEESRTGT